VIPPISLLLRLFGDLASMGLTLAHGSLGVEVDVDISEPAQRQLVPTLFPWGGEREIN